MAGKSPQKHTAPDMRKADNKAKYGTVENRDKTAPRGKLNPAQQTVPATPTTVAPELQPLVQPPVSTTTPPTTKGK